MMKRFTLGLFAFTALAAFTAVSAAPVLAQKAEASGAAPAADANEPAAEAAEDEAPSSTDDSEKIDDPVAKAKSKSLNNKYVSILANLDTREAQHFAIVIVNQNLIGTVKAVEEDVAVAAKGCAENNKQMADTINARFAQWQEAVKAPMQEAQANVDNMVVAQTYITKEQYTELFGLIDDVRKYNSSRFEKTPVTTPEACEFMLSKMDETQENMVGMLRATLASYPAAQQKTQE